MVFILRNIDLNLIRTFVTLYKAKSVTLAADKLFVTQPSVSYALSKLREIFNDRLFVRAKEGMEPTAYATQLYGVFNHSLKSIEHTLEGAQNFEAFSTEKRFTLAMTDLGEMALLPRIFKKLQKKAPNLELEVIPLEIDKVDEWLATGRVDAVICSRTIPSSQVERRVILKEQYVCVMHQQFSLDCDELTMEQFISQKHALVTRSLGHGLAEEVLSEMGVNRKISLVLPHFSVLPYLLKQTELMVILPRKIANEFLDVVPLKVYPLPFEVPSFEVALYWSKLSIESPSLHWFREIIAAAVGAE
jgi:DNA-binding transcriptional LysR family regulator